MHFSFNHFSNGIKAKERKRWSSIEQGPMAFPQIGTQAIISDATKVIVPGQSVDAATKIISHPEPAVKETAAQASSTVAVNEPSSSNAGGLTPDSDAHGRKKWAPKASLHIAAVGTVTVFDKTGKNDDASADDFEFVDDDDEDVTVVQGVPSEAGVNASPSKQISIDTSKTATPGKSSSNEASVTGASAASVTIIPAESDTTVNAVDPDLPVIGESDEEEV